MSSKRIIQRSPENLTVTISMDRELHDRLHARAKSLRLSKSALVRLMIAADLDGRGRENKCDLLLTCAHVV